MLDQFNKIFSTPNVQNRVNDPVSYFTSEMGSLTPQLSNITIDKNKIIEAIHDLSTHSAPGPDGVPAIVFNSLESTGDNGRQPPFLPPRPRATRVDTRIHNYRLSAAP